MIPLAAYAERMSVRPGHTIRFHAANTTGQPVDASISRVICADANPAGPGLVLEPTPARLTTRAEPKRETVPSGSYMRAPNVGSKIDESGFTFVVNVRPTRIGHGRACVFSSGSATGGEFALFIDANGCLSFESREGAQTETVHVARPLVENRWYRLWLSVANIGASKTGSAVSVGFRALDSMDISSELVVEGSIEHCVTWEPHGPMLIAACGVAQPHDHFNGKIEVPTIFAGALDAQSAASIDVLAGPAGGSDGGSQRIVAAWDFGGDAATHVVHDRGAHAFHGELVNAPNRAMTGSNWSAKEMCFRHAPNEYGAVHFHDDDVEDCHWPVCYEWTVPEGTRSGVYGLMLRAGDAQDNVPFHVVPAKGTTTARLAVLASTFTYTIYGNHARPEWDNDPAWKARWRSQTDAWGAYPHNPGEHREYGLSTYNVHSDGSGIGIASWHRPMLNVRIGYLTYPDADIRGSGLRHFPADSHLIAWLEDRAIPYDVITDQELHDEGLGVLENYAAVVTGSHPEYHTPAMLDALTAYRDQGGRLAYLGGNGFYWKIALGNDKPGVVEIRRGEGGIRAWAAEPGEYYNQFDGEYGGMWRRNGRAPQQLCGVGFTAQGNFAGSYYRKCDAATDPRVSWILDGVEEEVLGDHGLSAHGAAGFELDRADTRLGTPLHAVVVARSENHPPDAPWVLVPEELLTHITTWPGGPASDHIHADMTFFETPGGGAVFSVGSITFCGSLPTDSFNNDISRLLENVIRRFADPTLFSMPN
ncbi:MAG: N,N-dimethylformamidase [Gammaproteobacteria bacterium]|jgi:N,N-dimethylformamidase